MTPERAKRFGKWRKIIGITLIVIGLISLVTPLTPGSWLALIGAQMLGIELIYWKRLQKKVGATLARWGASVSPRVRKIAIYVFTIGASLAAGAIGTFFTMSAILGWYAGLEKPWWTPPNYVFGPVWTSLYILMGIAAARVWNAGTGPARTRAIQLFFAHLVVNATWSVVFFGAHAITAALALILLLAALIIALIRLFAPISPLAAWLLTPYLAWVLYATSLNAGILVLN